MNKLGYLGPEGTFSHLASKKYAHLYTCIPYDSFYDILYAVDNGDLEYALVPIENSIEGAVTTNLDLLAFDVDLFIIEETLLPVRHYLWVHPETTIEQIQSIISHPQPLGQCKKYLHTHFPNIRLETSSSTSTGCEIASKTLGTAAIANIECGQKFGLKCIAENIQDFQDNQTRFVLLQKKPLEIVPLEGKTSMVFSTPNEPGKLCEILSIFSLWNLNMTRIESRPSKNKLGEYVYFIDIEGTVRNEDVRDALRMIQRKTHFYKFLGSYSQN